jgi:hypothetical protein
MASSAAAGGVERLAREIDPLANEADILAGRLHFPEIMVMIEHADNANFPLALRTYEIAARHIVSRAIAKPSDAVVRLLGQRPTAEEGSAHSGPENSLHGSWDRAVGAVALYKAAHRASPFPSDNPVDELIGLRALSPDPEAWDRVSAAMRQHIDVATHIDIANEQFLDLETDIVL